MVQVAVNLPERLLDRVKTFAERNATTVEKAIEQLVVAGLACVGGRDSQPGFRLKAYNMGQPRVSLYDKEALYAALDDEVE